MYLLKWIEIEKHKMQIKVVELINKLLFYRDLNHSFSYWTTKPCAINCGYSHNAPLKRVHKILNSVSRMKTLGQYTNNRKPANTSGVGSSKDFIHSTMRVTEFPVKREYFASRKLDHFCHIFVAQHTPLLRRNLVGERRRVACPHLKSRFVFRVFSGVFWYPLGTSFPWICIYVCQSDC